jgi:hypothetical protein
MKTVFGKDIAMKKLIAALLICLSTSAAALDSFFYKEAGYWTVYGIAEEDKVSCVAKTIGLNDQHFLIAQNITTGEFYAELKNDNWKFEGSGTVFLTFSNDKVNKGNKKELSATFEKVTDTIIQIRMLERGIFLPPFVEFDKLSFLFQGDASISVGLKNSRASIVQMGKCIEASAPHAKTVIPNDPPPTTIPADPKINMTLPKVES